MEFVGGYIHILDVRSLNGQQRSRMGRGRGSGEVCKICMYIVEDGELDKKRHELPR